MYKMIKVFNVKREGNEVKTAEYSVVHEFEQFEIDEKTRDMLLDYCKANNLEYGSYSIVEYKNNEPVAVVGQLFYHSEDDELESWMDMAEWNERVIASVALGYDIVLCEESKKKIKELAEYQKQRTNSMELTDLLGMLVEQNKSGNGYQIQLNSGNLDETSNRNTDVELGDMYFTECSILNKSTLCFGNSNRKPVTQKEDGTNLYPMEINSCMFIDLCKIECVEEVKDFEDWFEYPSEKVINLYMYPQNANVVGCRNVITIGFMA